MSAISASPLTVLLFLVFSAFFFFCVQGCPPNELHALFNFKSAINDTRGQLESWKGHNCCAWDGVQCLGRHVSVLDLSYRWLSSVSGEMPWSSLVELKHLKYLDFTYNEFHGEIPSQLGGLSSLRHLDLSYSFSTLTSHNLEWLSNLSSLEYLSLSGVNVSDKNWATRIGSLLHLKHLDLSKCSLAAHTIPRPLLNLSYLAALDLSYNSFSNIPTWMVKLTSLTHLHLAGNNFSGGIPNTISHLTGLKYLDLSRNALTSFLGLYNLSDLETLYLYDNQLQGNIPSGLGKLHKLKELSLYNNHLSGSLPPSFALLSSLTYLSVSDNRLNESIPSAFMLPSSLVELHLKNNSMNGTITEVFFQKSSKLEILRLCHSGLSINISSTWIPPFQLKLLVLEKCQIGGPIPSWISTQFSLVTLDLSGTQLTGNLPSWLWDMDILWVRLSDNHLQGSFTPRSGPLTYLDLSMNELSGSLPAHIHKLLSNAKVLILADNRFVGKIPPSIANLTNLQLLDMSGNYLTGNIPAVLCNLTDLEGLHLQNNYLEGEIPKELGTFSHLRSLRIGNNSLQGFIPSSLKKLSSLQVFDVGENNLIGSIPHWIANFSSLYVLLMRSNNFRGVLPPDIGRMPNLRVLDLSSNFFSGTIPHSYMTFPAMQNSTADGGVLLIFSEYRLDTTTIFGAGHWAPWEGQKGLSDSIDLIVKGQERHYQYVYLRMASLDLSNNKLSGPLPPDIDNLKRLMYLNLSMNNLSGPIPQSLGNLVQLESVDLCFNKFSGNIPHQLGNLTYLAHLNLSHNNLYGTIPLQGPQMLTFDKWSYIGNPDLWGCPLEKNCSRPGASPPLAAVGVEENTEEGFDFEYVWYWMCFGLSVGLGFLAVVALLVLNLSWRVKAFNVMDRVIQEMDRVIS